MKSSHLRDWNSFDGLETRGGFVEGESFSKTYTYGDWLFLVDDDYWLFIIKHIKSNYRVVLFDFQKVEQFPLRRLKVFLVNPGLIVDFVVEFVDADVFGPHQWVTDEIQVSLAAVVDFASLTAFILAYHKWVVQWMVDFVWNSDYFA